MNARLHTRQHFTNLPLAALAVGGLLTLFVAIGAATSTPANAEFWIKANGKKLEVGEEELYKWDLTSVKFVWAVGVEKLKVLCKEGKGNGKIIGGVPGTDKITEFELKECKLVEPPPNCVLQKERVEGEELPWPSTLELRGGRIFDNITFKKVPFKVEKCNNAALNLLWNLRGNLLVEMQNNKGKVKTIFPGSEVEGDSLETEGDKVLMTGEGEMEATETGKTMEVGEGSCGSGTHIVFCNDAEIPIVGDSVEGTLGLALLAGHIGGTEAKFGCLSGHLAETLGALGSFTGLGLYLGCKEERPAKCKLSTTQEKEIDVNFVGQQESATLALLTGSGSGEEFTKLNVEGTECAVPGEYSVTGRQMIETPEGGITKVDHELVAKKSGSSLRLGTETASFSGTATSVMLSSALAWLVMAGE